MVQLAQAVSTRGIHDRHLDLWGLNCVLLTMLALVSHAKSGISGFKA